MIEEFAAIILRKILTPWCTGFVDLQSPAGIINSVLVYDYDGYLYASDESRMLAEEGDYTFRIGSVKERYEDLLYSKKFVLGQSLGLMNCWQDVLTVEFALIVVQIL